MIQDKTGLMYLDYESKIPIVGNLWFSLARAREWIDKKVKVDGWFFRGVSSSIVVNRLEDGEKILK